DDIDIAEAPGIVGASRVEGGVSGTAAISPSRLIGRQVEVDFVGPLATLDAGIGEGEDVARANLFLHVEKHALVIGEWFRLLIVIRDLGEGARRVITLALAGRDGERPERCGLRSREDIGEI